MIGIELVKKQKTPKGKAEVAGNGKLLPVVLNGKKQMMSKPQVEKLLKKEPKPKVKFQSNENSVDVEINENNNPKQKKEVKLSMLVDAVKDVVEIKVDKQGYTDLRTSDTGKLIAYAKDRRDGITIWKRDAKSTSVWKANRLNTKGELDDYIETIRASAQNFEKYGRVSAFSCHLCDFLTLDEAKILEHIKEH